MTIALSVRTAGPYTGTGLVSVYPFSFKIFQERELLVRGTDLVGGIINLALTSDYAVVLNRDQELSPGGTIILAAPLASGYMLHITSEIPATQPMALTNGGGFFPRTIEQAFDRITILIQQLIEGQSRSLRLPFSDTSGGTEIANSADRANKIFGFDSSGRLAYVIPISGSAADVALQIASLITDLANATVANKGAGKNGFNPSLAYTGQTVGAGMRAHGLPMSLFAGADASGVLDNAFTIGTAIGVSASTGRPLVVDGSFRHTSALTLATNACLMSSPSITDSVGVTGPGRLYKDFNGTGLVISGDAVAVHGLQIDNAVGRTGTGVQVLGSRVSLSDVAITRPGGVGLRINDDVGAYNTNLFYLQRIVVVGGGDDGIRIDDGAGATDAGAGLLVGADLRNNAGDGIRAASGTWNTYIGVAAQVNTGYGFRLTAADRSSLVLGGDLEGNIAGQGVIEANSFAHIIIGPFYGSVPAWVDNSGYPGRNVVMQYDPDVAKITWGEEVNLCTPRAGGNPQINLHCEVAKRGVARIAAQSSGTAGGTLKLYTQIDGGALAVAVQCDERQRTWHRAAVADTLIDAAYSASITLDASQGNAQTIAATDGSAFVINAPSNPFAGQLLEVTIRNISGGALGTATWNAAFKMRAWLQPANGFSRAVTLRYNGANWAEKSRTEADIPN